MTVDWTCQKYIHTVKEAALANTVFGFMRLDLVEIDYESLSCTLYHSLLLDQFKKSWINIMEI